MRLLQGLDRGHRLRAVDPVDLAGVVAGLGERVLQARGVARDGRLRLHQLVVGQAARGREQLQPRHLECHRGRVELLRGLHQWCVVADAGLRRVELLLSLLDPAHCLVRRQRVRRRLHLRLIALRRARARAGGGLDLVQRGTRFLELLVRRHELLASVDRSLSRVRDVLGRLGQVRPRVSYVADGRRGRGEHVAVPVQREDVLARVATERSDRPVRRRLGAVTAFSLSVTLASARSRSDSSRRSHREALPPGRGRHTWPPVGSSCAPG